MTGRERIRRILRREPADRIGLFEHFWGDTLSKWRGEGRIPEGESLEDHFGFDIRNGRALNLVADLDFQPETIEETDETILQRDGNGAVLRRHKLHSSTPEHVDFAVRDRAGWERLVKPRLLEDDPRRIDFEAYRNQRAAAGKAQAFFNWSSPCVFENIHPVCGHENMLIGVMDDPEWVADMAMTYAALQLRLQERLFEQEGRPDGVWYYEDMGFKFSPFLSPAQYRALFQPAHRMMFGFARRLGLPVTVHSCGFIEPLLPHLLEAGIDCLQVIEVKAGMDLLRIFREYGDRLSLMGGIDVRVLYSNDRRKIDAELEAKLPVVKTGRGYVLHSDHSIPDTVEYDTYRYFVDRGMQLGIFPDSGS